MKHGFFQPDDKQSIDEFLKNHSVVKAKPFIKWVGGKRQLLSQFRDLYPLPDKFDIECNTYFEPFVGGGAVFFDIQPYSAVLSDINKELVTTYQVIKTQPEKLISALQKHKHDKEYYLQLRAKNPNKMSDVNVAARFIYLNRTGFNGLYRVNKSGGFNVPFGRYKNPKICDAENIRNVSTLLQNVEIKHRDYREVVKEAKAGDFIYFDPPYIPLNPTSSFTSYTKDGFGIRQQEELRDVFACLAEKGCFVMLSNSDTPLTRELYRDFNVHSVQAGRAINSNGGKRGKVGEVVVCNY